MSQSISFSDAVDIGYVGKPIDWNALSSPDGLKSRVEAQVGTVLFENQVNGHRIPQLSAYPQI